MSVLSAPTSATHDIGGARFTSLATPTRGSVDSSVWIVEIDPGTPATPHQLTREEVFVVLSGRAWTRIDGHEQEAAPGDAIVVPRDTPFELRAAGEEPMRAMVCFPVGGKGRIGDGEPFTPPWAA